MQKARLAGGSAVVGWLALLALVTGVRLYTITQVPLTGDEAYYWLWSRHLAFGYYDHPPLIAWSVALSNAMFGVSVFSARVAGPLLGAVAATFVFLLGREVSGNARTGALAAALFLLAPLAAVGSMAIVPDVPLLAAWSGTLFFLFRALFTTSRGAWWIAGVFLGLGILSKLIALFLIPSLFAYLMFSRTHRTLLRRPEPYVFTLTGLAVASPFLVWNATHDWETFVYQFTLRLVMREPQQALFNPRSFVDFVVYQSVALSPVIFVLAVGALVYLMRNGLRRKPRHLFLAMFCLPVLLFFAAVSFRTRGGEHWPFAGYISLLAGMAWISEGFGRAYRVSLATGMALAGMMSIGVFVLLLQPNLLFALAGGGIDYHGINKGQPVPPADLAEIYGYEALGRKVGEIVAEMERSRDHPAFIITDSYTLSSVLAFYSGRETHVARGSILGREYRRWGRFDTKLGENALYIDVAPYGARPDIADMLRDAFERVEPDAPFLTDKGGQPIRPFYLVRCYGFRRNVFQ